MAKVERIEPTQLPNGLWLDGNEYASENVEESSGVLSLETGETEGYRVSPELDVGAISDVGISKLEWTSSGDVEVSSILTQLDELPSITDADGADDGITFSSAPNLPGDQTVMVWANMQAFESNSEHGDWLISLRSQLEGNRSFQIVYSGGGNAFRIGFWLSDDTSIGLDFSTSQPSLNTWYHLCYTFKSGEILRVYQDGTLSESSATALGPRNAATNMSFFRVTGWAANYNYLRANAKMAHVKMWNRVLTQSEIQHEMYHDPDLTDTNLAHWWPLGKYGAADQVGSLNGTVTGAAVRDAETPLWRPATNLAAIPSVSVNDDLTGKYLHLRQDLSRDTTGDPSPTLTELKATVEEASGALPLINGGLIRSAHTQNNTMIR